MTDTVAGVARGIGDNRPPKPIDPVAPIRTRVNALVVNANRWASNRPSIMTPDEAVAAKDFADQLRAEAKAAEIERKAINAPWQAMVDANNATFRTLNAMLAACVAVLQPKLDAWAKRLREEQDRIKRETEQKAIAAQREADRLKAAAAKAADTGKGDVVGLAVAAQQAEEGAAAAFKKADKAAAAQPILKGSYGGRGSSLRTFWKFEITDAAAVPREWLMPDEIKIGAAVRRKLDGSEGPPLRALAGVRIFSEEKTI